MSPFDEWGEGDEEGEFRNKLHILTRLQILPRSFEEDYHHILATNNLKMSALGRPPHTRFSSHF